MNSLDRPKENDGLFATLIEQAPVAVYVLDAQLRLVQINSRAQAVFDWSFDLIGQPLLQVLTSIWSTESSSALVDRMQQTLNTGTPSGMFESTARRRGNEHVEHYQWKLRRVVLPTGAFGVACCFEDISQRRQDEIASARHARWQDFLADISAQLLLSKQPRTLLNAVFGRLADELGLEVHLNFSTASNGDRLHLAGAVGLDDAQLTVIRDHLLTDNATGPLPDPRQEFICQGIEGTAEPPFSWLRALGAKSCIGIPLRSGSHLLGALVMVSMTRARITEAETQLTKTVCQLASVSVDRASLLEETQLAKDLAETANRAKDDFLAAVSHELRTPLNPALILASQNAADPSLTPDVRQDFATIARCIELESRLIDDLLDLSRVVAGKHTLEMRPVDVHQALAAAEETVRQDFAAKQITTKNSLTATTSVVMGDSLRLQQVFWNIFRNAAKFSPPATIIDVETRTIADEIQVSISDQGVGMTASQIAQVFNRFWQGQHVKGGVGHQFGGLGLGLPISQRLIESHSGTIRAVSPGLNRGTTFVVTLPLASAGELPAVPVDTAQTGNGSSNGTDRRKVLVVEDHEPTRTALQRLLTRRNYSVVAAGSAAEARAAFAEQAFDLLICDIGLPDATGFELMAELKLRREIKGIAVTGYGADEDIERSREAGFFAHVTKPMNIKALSDALESLHSLDHQAEPRQP